MKMLFGTDAVEITEIDTSELTNKNISLSVARFDLIDPIVSGNKIFKLHYFLSNALREKTKTLITFGGAFSNHLVATAYAGKKYGLNTIGIVRGEKGKEESTTLKQCELYGMVLQYISRNEYEKKSTVDYLNSLREQYANGVIIPEGGYAPIGAMGASLMMQHIQHLNATHVVTAIGTATSFAGLLRSSTEYQQVVGIPVLKNLKDIDERLEYLNPNFSNKSFILFDEYHFGGYAKKTPALINFMNDLFISHALPTDWIYTAKMMFAIFDKIINGSFPDNSRIVCLHTGGLQGNKTLPAGTLVF